MTFGELIYLWVLLSMTATYYQFPVLQLAYQVLQAGVNGFYVYRVNGKKYVYVSRPTTYAYVIEPDLIVLTDGTFLFYDRTFLHRSILLTFLPIVPGIIYLLLWLRIKRYQKIDKYLIKDEYVNELSHTDPE